MGIKQCIKCSDEKPEMHGFCGSCWSELPAATRIRMEKNGEIKPKPKKEKPKKPEEGKIICRGAKCRGILRPAVMFTPKKTGELFKNCDICRKYDRDHKNKLKIAVGTDLVDSKRSVIGSINDEINKNLAKIERLILKNDKMLGLIKDLEQL